MILVKKMTIFQCIRSQNKNKTLSKKTVFIKSQLKIKHYKLSKVHKDTSRNNI